MGQNEENQTPADAYVVYTYPDRVQAGKPFQVGVILQYINDKNARTSWIVFSDVFVKLSRAQLSTSRQVIGQVPVPRTCDNKTVSDSDTSSIIVKGKLYSHHFSLFAPVSKCAGGYLVFLSFHAIFSPESIGETGFDWCAGCRYLNASAGGGEILPNELPTFNVTDKDNHPGGMGRLIVGIEEPYGHIRPIPVNVTHTAGKSKVFSPIKVTDRKEINIPYGSHYVVVPKVIDIDNNNVHAVFSGWSDGNNNANRSVAVTPNNDTNLFALYDTEYHLSVESNSWLPTQPSGTGWYPAGSDAKFGIDPSLMFFGLHSFDHWKADNYTIFTSDYASPVGSLTMDGPKEITALWKWDYGYIGIVVGIVAVAVPVLRKFWGWGVHEVKRKG